MTWELGCPRLGHHQEAAPSACIWWTDAARYRQLQEVAYVNHEGASALSVVALMLIYPLTVVMWHYIAVVAGRFRSPSWGIRGRAIQVLSEIMAPTLPLTAAFSSPHLVLRSLAMHVVILGVFAAVSKHWLEWPRLLSQYRASQVARKAGTSSPCFTCIDSAGQRLRFVAEYRAVIMLTTCIAILAVDFPAIFPRTHAKTEEYGYSLMDLGAGSFVISNAIVSRVSRGGEAHERRFSKFLRQVAALWPVLLLGLVRLLVLWGIDYHVPQSEYGVHWNFFFTVAVLSLVATAANLGPAASAFAGASVLVMYQVFLTCFRGGEYVLHAKRVNLFSANREGILSCIGFLGVHWIAAALGSYIRSPRPPTERLRGLFLVAAGGLLVDALHSAAGIHASRRMCNLPYAAFLLGINAFVLGLLALIDFNWPRPREPLPLVYGGVQDSMLATFLLANLLTGAMNVWFQPLIIPAWAAFPIMLLYTLVLASPLALLRSKGIALKFW